MNFRYYEIFYTAAECGSFTKAAKRLFLTQSAVSHAVRELEEKMNTRLFDRTGRTVHLTGSGRLLLQELAPILASYRKLEERLPRLERESPLKIVSCITIAAHWLPKMIVRFQKEYPDTPVEVEVVSAASAEQRLREGSAELALVEGVPMREPYVSRVFSSYEMHAFCASGYRSAAESSISLRSLLKEPLLLREPGSAIRNTFDSRLLLEGLRPEAAWYSVNSQALIEAAKAGIGVTVLPDILVRRELEEGTLVRLEVEDLDLKNDLMAVWHHGRCLGYAAEKFLNFFLYPYFLQ